jgi:hypothetical protein
MKDSQRYVKIVEWSELDGVYVGSAPDLFYGGCHGDDEVEVFRELLRWSRKSSRASRGWQPLCPFDTRRELADSYPRMTRAPGANASQMPTALRHCGTIQRQPHRQEVGKRAILWEPDDDALTTVKAVAGP